MDCNGSVNLRPVDKDVLARGGVDCCCGSSSDIDDCGVDPFRDLLASELDLPKNECRFRKLRTLDAEDCGEFDDEFLFANGIHELEDGALTSEPVNVDARSRCAIAPHPPGPILRSCYYRIVPKCVILSGVHLEIVHNLSRSRESIQMQL